MSRFRRIFVFSAVLVLIFALYSTTSFAADNASKVGTVTCSALNIRELPSTSSKVITKLLKGSQVNIISTSDGWYKVSQGKTTGYVSAEYLKVTEASIGKAIIETEVLNLRSEPDTDSKVLDKLHKGETVTALSKSGAWYRIKTSDGQAGWLHGDYITIRDSSVSRGDAAVRTTAASDKKSASDKPVIADSRKDSDSGQDLVAYARKYMDSPYRYGGESPNGFDCSGFTQYVFKKFGVSLERSASSQAGQGKAVRKSDLKIGDLLFFATGGSGSINHVGIYIGNGKFIHAESKREGVTITGLSENYYKRSYVTARRKLN